MLLHTHVYDGEWSLVQELPFFLAAVRLIKGSCCYHNKFPESVFSVHAGTPVQQACI